MKHPSLGRNSAAFINVILLVFLIILIIYKTSMINDTRIIKEISVPDQIQKFSQKFQADSSEFKFTFGG